ncbi:unnamed protein product [Polarella glacialis]|uniref:Uncharacterized protein n=1 Tax=Polarella glacialis TaxID=89957 RepID=A0A813HYT5_POLGL|nr:unnamed protein product [Polarella glacialis]
MAEPASKQLAQTQQQIMGNGAAMFKGQGKGGYGKGKGGQGMQTQIWQQNDGGFQDNKKWAKKETWFNKQKNQAEERKSWKNNATGSKSWRDEPSLDDIGISASEQLPSSLECLPEGSEVLESPLSVSGSLCI